MIIHADLNSFFARAEQQANAHLRDKPIGILGKGHKGARTCVCAASPEAKVFGIKAGFSVWEAQRLCPSIILVPPDYPKYLDISRRFIKILESESPWVEIFSIDEAFVRLDGGVDEAITSVRRIKEKMRDELGELLTASVGVAWGKTFAKLAGELQKPDGLTILEKDTWLNRVGELPAAEICGIGRRLTEHLAVLKIHTINDLSCADAGILVARFGRSTGMRLWQIGQGIDDAPVQHNQAAVAPKSIGHQLTLDQDTRFDGSTAVIRKLTKKVARRMRQHGLATGHIGLYLSLSNHRYAHASARRSPVVATDSQLLETTRQLAQRLQLPPWQRIRRIGVIASDLEPNVYQSLPLDPHITKEEQITASLDVLRDRYGENSIEWGSAFGVDIGNLRDWRGPRAVLET